MNCRLGAASRPWSDLSPVFHQLETSHQLPSRPKRQKRVRVSRKGGTIYLVKVEYEIKLTDIVKVLIEYLDKVVNRLQVDQIIIAHVDADTKVKTSVASVDNFKVSELKSKRSQVSLPYRPKDMLQQTRYLDKVGVLRITNRNHSVNLLN